MPKSRGGRETAPIHPVCHRAIHAALTNRELAGAYAEPAVLRAEPELARFIAWVAAKPADFHVATHRQANDDERWRRSRRHG